VAFAMNRFLRLYPPYWIALILSCILIYVVGDELVQQYHAKMYLPITFQDYFSNISMLWLNVSPSSSPSPRLVPPAWALTVEIFFYVLICLGISKTFYRVKWWLLLSVLYVVGSFMLDYTWHKRHFPLLAASLPFALGSAIYFLSMAKEKNILSKVHQFTHYIYALLLVNCVTWCIATKYMQGMFLEIGFYINLMLCVLLVYGLVKGGVIVNLGKKWDKHIGDIAYPVYLFHWQIGLMTSFLLFGEPFHEFSERGFINWCVSLLIVCMVAILVVKYIDEPVQRIRKKIKERKVV